MTDQTSRRSRPKPQAATVAAAGQWQLIWWRFRQHRLALVSGVVIVLIYLVADLRRVPGAGVVADLRCRATPMRRRSSSSSPAPTRRGVSTRSTSTATPSRSTRSRSAAATRSTRRSSFPSASSCSGEPYKLWGLFQADRHLIGPIDRRQPFYLFGADRLGRDVFSRTIHGTRVSMSVGLIGVTISLRPRHHPRRHLRALWRLGRRRHPARHRALELDPDHSALDGPGRRRADQRRSDRWSISGSR